MSCFSGPWIKPLALRDVYEIRKLVGSEPVIVGTGGITTFQDAVEMSMVGADIIGICTAIMINGFGFLEKLMKKLRTYLEQMGYESLRDVRDILVENVTTVSNLTIYQGVAVVDPDKCNGCRRCLKLGHCVAIELIKKKAYIDAGKCLGCGICTFLCPRNAIGMVER